MSEPKPNDLHRLKEERNMGLKLSWFEIVDQEANQEGASRSRKDELYMMGVKHGKAIVKRNKTKYKSR